MKFSSWKTGAPTLRQHSRFTVESHRIEQAALRFHRGEAPPAVTHCLRINPRETPDRDEGEAAV